MGSRRIGGTAFGGCSGAVGRGAGMRPSSAEARGFDRTATGGGGARVCRMGVAGRGGLPPQSDAAGAAQGLVWSTLHVRTAARERSDQPQLAALPVPARSERRLGSPPHDF